MHAQNRALQALQAPQALQSPGHFHAFWAVLPILAALALAPTPAAAENVNGWDLTLTQTAASDQVLSFTQEELRLWLGSVQPPQPETPLQFQLTVDGSLQPFTYAIASSAVGNGRAVTLAGASSNETLAAAYTALEAMGYQFFISGPVYPASLNLAALPTTRKVYVPTVQRRGIRQHINFPMDVSSYPLDEAKQYVRNLARQRYNWITFHSYPGHWTWDRYADIWAGGYYHSWVDSLFHLSGTAYCSGAFFYGDHFPIPAQCSLVRDKIRFNQAIYCMPDVETNYFTVTQRGQTMNQWLAAVMNECKRVGMKVQFSTEIRLCDDSFNLGLVGRIMADFPMIDALEFISREGGDPVPGDFTTYYNKQVAFMNEILAAPDGKTIDAKYAMFPAQADVIAGTQPDVQVKDLAFGLRLAKLLTQNGWAAQHNNVQLVVGNYSCDASSVKLVCQMAAQYLPANMWYSLMAGHSSLEVASFLSTSLITQPLLARTMFYSWIEYDGFMALQQMAGSGIYNAIGTEQTILGAGAPIQGILCNHWRTGENFLSFRYASQAMLDTKPTLNTFLTAYAQNAGMTSANRTKFVNALTGIDTQSRNSTLPGNIGFCIKSTYDISSNIGTLKWWTDSQTDVNTALTRYQTAIQNLTTCLADVTNPQFQQQLKLLLNRCQASYAYLKAILVMKGALIRMTQDAGGNWIMPTNLTPTEKATIVQTCAQAGVYARQYMELTGQYMVDRSVEGFLINSYYNLPAMIHNFQALYGGQGQAINTDTGVGPIPFMLLNKNAVGAVAGKYE